MGKKLASPFQVEKLSLICDKMKRVGSAKSNLMSRKGRTRFADDGQYEH